MSTRARIVILAAWAVAVGAVLATAWSGPDGAPREVAGGLATARNWLAVILGGYAVNYALAWIYRTSWTVTLVRSLIWAVVAYVCISDIVDIFGENREIAWQILGRDGPGHPGVVGGLRLRLALRVLGLVSSALCIGVGFERRDDSDPAGDDGAA